MLGCLFSRSSLQKERRQASSAHKRGNILTHVYSIDLSLDVDSRVLTIEDIHNVRYFRRVILNHKVILVFLILDHPFIALQRELGGLLPGKRSRFCGSLRYHTRTRTLPSQRSLNGSRGAQCGVLMCHLTAIDLAQMGSDGCAAVEVCEEGAGWVRRCRSWS